MTTTKPKPPPRADELRERVKQVGQQRRQKADTKAIMNSIRALRRTAARLPWWRRVAFWLGVERETR